LRPAKSVEIILEEAIADVFGNDKKVKNVSIVSKTGLAIAGRSSEQFGGETFSAMAAIMFSSAETTRKDILKEDTEFVMAKYKRSMLLIAELTSDLLIAVVADGDADQEALLEMMRELASRAKTELTWLR